MPYLLMHARGSIVSNLKPSLRQLTAAMALLFATGSVNAAWVLVADPNLLDNATNPGFSLTGPIN